jgi:hypothetical protein
VIVGSRPSSSLEAMKGIRPSRVTRIPDHIFTMPIDFSTPSVRLNVLEECCITRF